MVDKYKNSDHIWLSIFWLGFSNMIFTWYCARPKDVKTVQENSEVYVKTHQVVL